MRILKIDRKKASVTVQPENADDLWILEKMIERGCVIVGNTKRSIKIQRGDEEEKGERRWVFVRLLAEKTEFNENQLRVGGKIIEASEGEHGYHTFEIEAGRSVTIEKEWKSYEIERLKAAKAKQPKILICVLDDSEADFALLFGRLTFLTSIRGVSGKEYGEQDKRGYFGEIERYLKDKDCEKIIVAGPGFTKEDFFKSVEDGELKRKIITDSVSTTGEAGIQEVLRRGIVERVTKDSYLDEQTRLVERFFSELGKGGLVTYGMSHVKEAVEMGACETLVISDKLVRENEGLLKKAEGLGGSVKIIESENDSGRRFEGFGVACFLRFRV